jgi:hypothetical protein
MSDDAPPEIEKILKEWYKVKKQVGKLQEQEEKIKKVMKKYMTDSDSSKVETRDFVVTLRRQKRETIAKANVPRDIWEKYCKESKFEVLTLKKIDDDYE